MHTITGYIHVGYLLVTGIQLLNACSCIAMYLVKLVLEYRPSVEHQFAAVRLKVEIREIHEIQFS